MDGREDPVLKLEAREGEEEEGGEEEGQEGWGCTKSDEELIQGHLQGMGEGGGG